MFTKISNYFYEFNIQKEGRTSSELLDIIYEEIDKPQYRLGVDYNGAQIKTNIVNISQSLTNPIDGEYGIVFHKGTYGIGLNFIDKDFNYTKELKQKDTYGRNSGKSLTETEEVHYYGGLKIGISSDEEYIVGIISVPRIRDGITSEEVSDLLKSIFEAIFKGKGYYRGLFPAYSQGEIMQMFSQSTEINFIKDVGVSDLIGRIHQKSIGNPIVSVRMKITDPSQTKEWGNYFGNLLGKKATDEQIRKELSPLRKFSIKTGKSTFNLDSDELKMKNIIDTTDYIYTLPVKERGDFQINNVIFIRNNFKNFFSKKPWVKKTQQKPSNID
ncbi:MAG: hypothetical protein HHAS10_06270 [Candidatus Altimarinota bacterium]